MSCLARIALIVPGVLAGALRVSFAQQLDREFVATALAAAEQQRDHYRVTFSDKYVVGERPPPGLRRSYIRVSDGEGRFKRIDQAPVSDMYGDTSVAVWSAAGAVTNRYTRADRTVPQLLTFQSRAPRSEHLDEIDIILGLRFFDSPRRPSDVVADLQEHVVVRERIHDGRELIEVVIIGPSFTPAKVVTNVYEPARQWALVEMRTIGSKALPVEREDINPSDIDIAIRYEMSEWQQASGIWIPMRVDDLTVFDPGSEREMTYRSVLEMDSVEIAPALAVGEFEISADNLPKGSTVTDGRLGISYKIGEDVLYMDGHLNQLTVPVTQVITAATLPEIMKGAVALIPPEAQALAAVGSGANWWRLGGIILFVAGAVSLGYVLWLKRRAAA
ncbi:MAG: hypothetical protein KJZ69_10990 [Phycisphaerales bacterium]|nr:hypothetical protein [Phycisphaerales bacterium]